MFQLYKIAYCSNALPSKFEIVIIAIYKVELVLFLFGTNYI